MDKAEFARINKQLDSLDDRVRKVIARRKPLALDRSARPIPKARGPMPKVQRKANDYTNAPAIASGQLEGHEMPFYEPPACRDEAPGFDYTRDVIFAAFNR